MLSRNIPSVSSSGDVSFGASPPVRDAAPEFAHERWKVAADLDEITGLLAELNSDTAHRHQRTAGDLNRQLQALDASQPGAQAQLTALQHEATDLLRACLYDPNCQTGIAEEEWEATSELVAATEHALPFLDPDARLKRDVAQLAQQVGALRASPSSGTAARFERCHDVRVSLTQALIELRHLRRPVVAARHALVAATQQLTLKSLGADSAAPQWSEVRVLLAHIDADLNQADAALTTGQPAKANALFASVRRRFTRADTLLAKLGAETQPRLLDQCRDLDRYTPPASAFSLAMDARRNELVRLTASLPAALRAPVLDRFDRLAWQARAVDVVRPAQLEIVRELQASMNGSVDQLFAHAKSLAAEFRARP